MPNSIYLLQLPFRSLGLIYGKGEKDCHGNVIPCEKRHKMSDFLVDDMKSIFIARGLIEDSHKELVRLRLASTHFWLPAMPNNSMDRIVKIQVI